ncbi:SKP1/ASK-Interacting protein 23, F-box/DUF295 Ancestral 11 [Hibiscus trionum]|uniref:SKP1/ASK-Interacting protein 23, F-box/DUF295 Ancestral 11 n=1 Tax=Hibiscus trionum TaxID=183268 RepID=A0A9W7JIG7_HIBTR|nr:SKP1/ASK-Interacting protein 23, F-box/DUF295 Ancestral 11 [Hibiscus trionum]
MGGWSELPVDVVRNIEEKLDLYRDKVKCRCVCSSWQLALPKIYHQKQNLLPWLLVPLKTKTEIGSGTSFGFFDPLEKKVHCLELSDPHKAMLFRGSSHGWVVNIDKNNSICAINPLTGAQVNLPPRTKFPDVVNYRADKPGSEYGIRGYDDISGFYFFTESKDLVRNAFIEKVILSSSPHSDEDFVAVAIYGNYAGLAYCKRGDKKWSFLDLGYWCDVIFHQQQLYAVDCEGSVVVFDIHGSLPKKTPLVSKLSQDLDSRFYLVESSGGLIMVHRTVDILSRIGISELDSRSICTYKTCGFRVFKPDTSRGEWYEIHSIGDDMLFLGWNSSFALSCKNFPGHAGNCIYFTDNNMLQHHQGIVGGCDVGIFNLSDGSIQHLPGYKTCDSELSIWPPPIWFMPNFI